MAAIIARNAPEHDIFNAQFCGGVLVDLDTVLTAAHCAVERPWRQIDVVIGADNLCRTGPVDGIRLHVRATSVHPRYDAASARFDLAYLVLDGTIDSQQVRDVAAEAAANVDAIALGWGRRSLAGAPTCRLSKVPIRTLSAEECERRLSGDRSFHPASMLCGLPSGGTPDDTCGGDSGGPLFAGRDPDRGLLLGIVSWGRGCGAGAPGVYALARAIDF